MIVSLVYQDCYNCPPSDKWYEANCKIAERDGNEIRPMAFYTPGAPALIKKAAKKNVGLPFFTDGNKFSKTMKAFTVKVKAKKTTKKASEQNGDNPEA